MAKAASCRGGTRVCGFKSCALEAARSVGRDILTWILATLKRGYCSERVAGPSASNASDFRLSLNCAGQPAHELPLQDHEQDQDRHHSHHYTGRDSAGVGGKHPLQRHQADLKRHALAGVQHQ